MEAVIAADFETTKHRWKLREDKPLSEYREVETFKSFSIVIGIFTR